ncbi:MAG: nitroreductase family protein [Bacillota bacterium]
MSLITIDESKCKRDGICVDVCPAKVIVIREKGSFPVPTRRADEFCIDCNHCVSVCPTGALALRNMKAEECTPILKELLPSAEQMKHHLTSRRSTRAFKDQPVDREILEGLINTANYAPSGYNKRPVQWLVIEKREDVLYLASQVTEWMRTTTESNPEMAQHWHFDKMPTAWDRGMNLITRNAPHIIVAHAPEDNPLASLDCHIATTFLELAAYSMGLGACWLGFLLFARDYPTIKEFVDLPAGHGMLGAALVGYPKYRYHRIPLRRKPKITWK